VIAKGIYTVDSNSNLGTWGQPTVVKHLRNAFGNSQPRGLAFDMGLGIPRGGKVVYIYTFSFLSFFLFFYSFFLRIINFLNFYILSPPALLLFMLFLRVPTSSPPTTTTTINNNDDRTCMSVTATATAADSKSSSSATVLTGGPATAILPSVPLALLGMKQSFYC
jgi:hypothetical protein